MDVRVADQETYADPHDRPHAALTAAVALADGLQCRDTHWPAWSRRHPTWCSGFWLSPPPALGQRLVLCLRVRSRGARKRWQIVDLDDDGDGHRGHPPRSADRGHGYVGKFGCSVAALPDQGGLTCALSLALDLDHDWLAAFDTTSLRSQRRGIVNEWRQNQGDGRFQ
jgi:hypothetical protein